MARAIVPSDATRKNESGEGLLLISRFTADFAVQIHEEFVETLHALAVVLESHIRADDEDKADPVLETYIRHIREQCESTSVARAMRSTLGIAEAVGTTKAAKWGRVPAQIAVGR